MRRRIADSNLQLVQGDITTQAVDAIVNAANSELIVGGGVDGAIHRAGGAAIHQETRERYPEGCPVGSALISSAGNLPAKYVIHAVGPVWEGGRRGEPEFLKSAYRSSLQLAVDHHCHSIAFPAISTGVFGYPIDRAAEDALTTIVEFLQQLEGQLDVRIVLFNAGAYGAFGRVLEGLIVEG